LCPRCGRLWDGKGWLLSTLTARELHATADGRAYLASQNGGAK